MAAAGSFQLSTGLGSVEVDASDVVRLMLQYMHENGLEGSAAALQKESGVALNAIERRDALVADVRAGRWAAVLPVVGGLELPREATVELYEHVALELLELREGDVARELLRATAALAELRARAPDRAARLERLLARAAQDAAAGAYASAEAGDVWRGDETKDARRNALADEVLAAVGDVAPSRLAALLGDALRWRAHTGGLGAGARIDVWRGERDAAKAARDANEKPPRRAAGAVRFGAESQPLCAAFLADGGALATGSSDGFVEIWDTETCRLRRDLPYQAADELLMHDAPVLALAPSLDGDALASGDAQGCLKVWRLATGECVRRFAKAHAAGVTVLAWSRDGTQIISASTDTTLKSFGLQSGKQLQQYRGHTAFVTAVALAQSSRAADDALLSSAADGSVRLWDTRSAECLHVFSPAAIVAAAERRVAAAGERERRVIAVLSVPATDRFVAVDASPTAVLLDVRGNLIAAFSTRDAPTKVPPAHAQNRPGCDFVAAALSRPRGDWLHALGDDGCVYSFSLKTLTLECVQPVAEATEAVTGFVSHPHANLFATFGAGDQLKLWKS